ncbi:metallophosphoesterase family protein [Sphingosinicella rhizophila]|uniref:Metallophosphoesterase n=1 Tax=Sphingosinicella rhizophila TaxID=3050082 RepID=A0ABU3Q8V7_9SPHN|nr:metallophosphoesterase [Sphingosinicella sp. GR2756]MDT9599834.1 metallophosphoesterase [Sphingosinicella sp. GR2756]
MASIAHLSDVHFGRHDPHIVQALETWLAARRPDLVVVSGDLTQRARVAQYRLAAAFIERLKEGGLPVLAVPGNHDVPLYDIFRRFARPLRRYRRFIDRDLCPWFENDELVVLGINTARSLTIKDGRISHEQMALIRERFRAVEPGKTRILVTHHPLFAMPIGEEEEELTKRVGRHEGALAAVAEAGVHILLAGHFHRSFARSAREMVETAGPELVIQAGTATSTRLRAEERQSFNWIEAKPDHVTVEVQSWDGAAFLGGTPAAYRRDGAHWHFAGPGGAARAGAAGASREDVDIDLSP